jgi:mRNA interferase HigB
MRVIAKKMLRDFWEFHADAEEHLVAWHAIVKRAKWKRFADVRRTYRDVDRVGSCYIFNITGNYRLIAKISPDWTIVFTCVVLTHKEYDREKWKSVCRCGHSLRRRT